ncbi:hypothetical protein CP8484711_2036 [Chlamydia psittaci 84-8471/1]|nr:hypothetical protein CP8484711_2036 [Chlamydia psittaci 84-8471/1]
MATPEIFFPDLGYFTLDNIKVTQSSNKIDRIPWPFFSY